MMSLIIPQSTMVFFVGHIWLAALVIATMVALISKGNDRSTQHRQNAGFYQNYARFKVFAITFVIAYAVMHVGNMQNNAPISGGGDVTTEAVLEHVQVGDPNF
jgi:hypothetical protein